MKFATFSAELAFQIVTIMGQVADKMPVLVFTIIRRDGMRRSAWIGLN